MIYREIEITTSQIPCTRGLREKIGSEIFIKSFGNYEGELALFKYLIDYVLDFRPSINDNETISYGLWLLKFIKSEAVFSIYELDDQFQNWIEGADNAVYYIEQ